MRGVWESLKTTSNPTKSSERQRRHETRVVERVKTYCKAGYEKKTKQRGRDQFVFLFLLSFISWVTGLEKKSKKGPAATGAGHGRAVDGDAPFDERRSRGRSTTHSSNENKQRGRNFNARQWLNELDRAP